MKNLLKKAFLLLALVGGATSVWATSYIPTTVKTIPSTGNYVFSDLQQGVTEGWVIYAAGTGGALQETTNKSIGFTDSDFGITDSNKDSKVSTVQVKADGGVFNSNKRVVHMLVTNITGVKAIGSADSGRGFQIGATEYSNSTSESTAMTVEAGNSSATNPVSYSNLDPSKTYIISIFAYNKDTFLYGVRFTADERSGAPISWPVSNYAATIGGSNTFPTLTNEGGMTVTYNSSKTGVATINETTGAISLVAQGTTTITATYTTTGPSDTYRTTKVSYELLVSNLAVQSNKFWNFSNDAAWSEVGTISATTVIDNMEILADNSNKLTLNSSGEVDFNGLSLTKFFSPGQVKTTTRQFHIRVAPKSMITVYIYCTGDSRKLKITKDSQSGTEITEQSVGNSGAQIFKCYYTGDIAADLYIFNSGSNGMNIYGVKVQPYIPVTVSSAGMATYVPTYHLDFSETTLKAYTVEVASQGVATLHAINKVPAGTPVLLINDGEITENIPVIASADAVLYNDLVAGTGAAVPTYETVSTTDDYTNMILNNGGDGIGFYFANNQTVATTRAYLHIATTLAPDAEETARGMILEFADEKITGINEAATATEAAQKEGKFVVDGKLVIFKKGMKFNANGARIY